MKRFRFSVRILLFFVAVAAVVSSVCVRCRAVRQAVRRLEERGARVDYYPSSIEWFHDRTGSLFASPQIVDFPRALRSPTVLVGRGRRVARPESIGANDSASRLGADDRDPWTHSATIHRAASLTGCVLSAWWARVTPWMPCLRSTNAKCMASQVDEGDARRTFEKLHHLEWLRVESSDAGVFFGHRADLI